MKYELYKSPAWQCFYSLVFTVGVMIAPLPTAAQTAGVPAQPKIVDQDIWEISRGGQLYDDWMAVLDAEPPNGSHPAYPKEGKKKGRTTWRCKECHGWDYMGEDGAYRKGAHYTGIKGVRNAAGKDVEEIVKIITDKTHGYTSVMIRPLAMRKLAIFIGRGQVGMDQYIDRSTNKARGNAARGALFFQTVCAICHGYDGSKMISRSDTALAVFGDRGYLGTIAHNNPWEVLHKIRNGQPGVGMVALRVLTIQDQTDVLAYVQTLRKMRE